jgi:predicted nucleotidyltransferase
MIATLRGHESELRAADIIRVSLFGSTARGDYRPDSDIDLLAALDDARRISLLDVVGMQEQISQMLGHMVELVEEGTLKPRVQKNVEAEAVTVPAFIISHDTQEIALGRKWGFGGSFVD